PQTMEPIAGVATHCEVSPDGMCVHLYLRGHAEPRGIPLPGARPHQDAVRWTDGLAVTAHDFVYAWRRVADPGTAAPYGYLLNCVAYRKEITGSKQPPAKLGVSVADDFCLRVDLVEPTPYFLQLLSWITLLPVPERAVEEARRGRDETAWTQ